MSDPIVGAQYNCMLNESKLQIHPQNGISDIEREAANVPLVQQNGRD